MNKPKMPKVAPAVPPVSMRSADVLDTSREVMAAEKKRKGIGSTILAGAYKPGGQNVPVSFGARTLLGQA